MTRDPHHKVSQVLERRLGAAILGTCAVAIAAAGLVQVVSGTIWSYACGAGRPAALAAADTVIRADFCDDDFDSHLYYDDHLAEGVRAASPPGGLFKEVESQEGYERHHMPARSVTGRHPDCTPAIRMETADHRDTASWGSGTEPQAYRKEQERLVKAGRFADAFEMDVQDIRRKFGSKYDEAIELARAALDRMC